MVAITHTGKFVIGPGNFKYYKSHFVVLKCCPQSVVIRISSTTGDEQTRFTESWQKTFDSFASSFHWDEKVSIFREKLNLLSIWGHIILMKKENVTRNLKFNCGIYLESINFYYTYIFVVVIFMVYILTSKIQLLKWGFSSLKKIQSFFSIKRLKG